MKREHEYLNYDKTQVYLQTKTSLPGGDREAVARGNPSQNDLKGEHHLPESVTPKSCLCPIFMNEIEMYKLLSSPKQQQMGNRWICFHYRYNNH